MTMYFEVVPKNAVEMALWLESDRMGYLENTVTQAAFVNQQNVVQNEKRQGVDNQPYGFNEYLILKNLYPEGHPYSWDVIGEMKDLTNATVTDVKAFHKKFYSPNNATLVIAGDINKDEIKTLVEKYFGEIPQGETIAKRGAIPQTSAKRLNYTTKIISPGPRGSQWYSRLLNNSLTIHMLLTISAIFCRTERRHHYIKYW